MKDIVLILLTLSCLTNAIGQLTANRRIKELEALWDILMEAIWETVKKEDNHERDSSNN